MCLQCASDFDDRTRTWLLNASKNKERVEREKPSNAKLEAWRGVERCSILVAFTSIPQNKMPLEYSPNAMRKGGELRSAKPRRMECLYSKWSSRTIYTRYLHCLNFPQHFLKMIWGVWVGKLWYVEDFMKYSMSQCLLSLQELDESSTRQFDGDPFALKRPPREENRALFTPSFYGIFLFESVTYRTSNGLHVAARSVTQGNPHRGEPCKPKSLQLASPSLLSPVAASSSRAVTTPLK